MKGVTTRYPISPITLEVVRPSQRGGDEKSVIECLAQNKRLRETASAVVAMKLSRVPSSLNELNLFLSLQRREARTECANERRDDRKMISPQISHHLKRTNPRGDRNRRGKVGRAGCRRTVRASEVKQTK